ncbi:hypothetical protein M3Y98_01052800 [Aphelenchoides besseyi]|nr:hypothetical protein M3Y98_01052800 [Aphelenchoides besseyi]KAI6209782.1 hypothetical protein M3Y96_00257100 [Aphelenchoides besseyi]
MEIRTMKFEHVTSCFPKCSSLKRSNKKLFVRIFFSSDSPFFIANYSLLLSPSTFFRTNKLVLRIRAFESRS